MLKKAKLYSLLALIVASTVGGLLTSPTPASAQTNTEDLPSLYIDPAIEKDINAKNLREAMLLCLRYNESAYQPNGTPAASLSNGEWFTNGEVKPSVGYLADSNNPYYACNEGGNGAKLVDKFLSVYTKWGTPFEAACAIGYRPSTTNFSGSEQDCLDSDGEQGVTYALRVDDSDREARRTAIDNAYPFVSGSGGVSESSPVQMYTLYMRTFQLACNPSSPKIESQLSAGDRNTHTRVTVVDGKGNATDVYYIVPDLTSNKKIRVSSIEGNSNENKNCQQIADTINQYAPAYAKHIAGLNLTDSQIATGTQNLLGNNSPGGDSGSGASTCRVDGIGWIVCPVVNLMAEMVDSSYYLLDNSLLRTPAISLDTDAPLYKAWKLMRDFANVAFVLIFMFIIFSQITNFGISNYGIKQLLPKLIIAAILVNLSYMICAVAVDASNIIGSELKGFFDSLADDIDTGSSSGKFEWASDGKGKAGVIGWGAIAGSILIAASLGGGVLAVLALLVPFLFAALGAVIATVITLIIRQALIIILIFVAPLAFVALLLPNTEGYFKSWRKLFQSLLLLYPVIAIVFGGSALASRIIMSAAEASTGDTALGEGLGGMTQTLLQLSGAAVSVIPLFLVPAVIKAAGGALNRFAGIVNNPNKGPIDWARNRSMKGVERMQKDQASKALERRAEELKNPVKKGRVALARGRAGDFLSGNSKYYRDADIKQEDTNRDRELALQEANYNTSQALAQADLTGKADGRKVREVATAVKQRDELKEKELQATIAVLDEIGLKGAANQELAMTGAVEFNGKSYKGEALQEAAAIRGFRVGGMSEKMQILEATGKDSGNEVLQGSRSRIVDEAIKTGMPKLAPQYASKNLDLLTQGDFEHDRDAVKNIKAGQFKSAGVASGHSYAFNRAVDAAIKANDVEAMDILKDVVDGIESNKNLIGEVRGDKEMLKTMDKVKRWQPQSPSTTQQSSQPQQQPTPTTTPQQPAVPPTSTSTPSPSNAGGATAAAPSSPSSAVTPPASDNWRGRQRDWSGYGQPTPADVGMPTQTESPTFTPSQPSTTPAPTSSTVDGSRQRDWSGYDQSSNATADAMEKVAKELKNTASQMDENNSYGTVERVKEAVSSTTAQTMQQFYDNQPASTPASPTPPSAPPTINGGRQRDWSGYGQSTPADTGMPTQTESPTFRPGSNNLK